MIIKYSYDQNPVPTDYVIVIASKAIIGGGWIEVNRVVYDPPQLNPRDVALFVPSSVVHLVEIYESPDGIELGILRHAFVATPSFDGPIVIPPMMIKVGGGRDGTESGGNGAVDPVDGATTVTIPAIDGLTVSWIEQRGAGPLKGAADVVSLDPTLLEWLRLDGNTIALQNGKTFNDQEEYWLYFEPTLDGNVSAAITDITNLLEAHIQNHDNPHETNAEQVGLGNLPNATSDAIDLDDSEVLATSKAVNDLRESIENKILGTGNGYIGNIGAVVANGNVSGVVNQNSNSSAVTITHGLDLADNYMVIGSFLSAAGSYMNDANITWAWKNATPNTFALIMKETSGTSQNVYFYFTLVKV